MIEQALVLCAGFHNINPRRLDAGMAQHVRQLGQVFIQLVKGPGKQVPQVVGEHLLPRHVGPFAQGL